MEQQQALVQQRSLIDVVYDPLESLLVTVGLLGDPYSWAIRFAVALIGTGTALLLLKPQFAFTSAGQPKHWSVTNPDGASKSPELYTVAPIWLVALLAGAAFALFV